MIQHSLKALSLLGIASINSAPALAQLGGGPFAGLKDFAKQVTIGIETPATSGSGVIIGSKGSTYFFLTAGHVVSDDPLTEEFYVYTLGGDESIKIRVLTLVRPDELKGSDIAIGSFKSDDSLLVAPIFALGGEDSWDAWRSYNGREYNQQENIQGDPVVAGVSIPTRAITVPLFRVAGVSIQDRAKGNQRGYEMVYMATSTVPGMSGGPIIGARVCPRSWYVVTNGGEKKDLSGAYAGLIGIHGMSEEYGAASSGRSGTSLGVPLGLLVKYFAVNSEKYGIPKGKSYEQNISYQCTERSIR